MLKSQELTIKLSEKRQKINDLLGKEKRSGSEINELDDLTKSVQGLEVEFRAAMTAEDSAVDDAKDLFGDDGEKAELRQLRDKVSVSNYTKAAIEGRQAASGAELEFNQALNIGADGFPLILLAGKEPEKRTTSDTDTAVRPRPWLDRLLADTMAAYLGISFTSVDPGVASYPVTTAGATGAQRGRTEAATAAAWTIGTKELKPTRNAVHLEFSKEDSMRIPMLDESLIRDLRAGLRESIDKVVFLGDDGANENTADITGLNTAASVVEKTLKQADKVKAGKTLEVFNSLIDGVHASGLDDLRIVASEGSHTLWTGQVLSVSNETASMFKTLANFLNDNGVMWKVRQLETATTNGKFGAFLSRQRGITGAAVAPVWSAGELIRDPYTKAKSGECLLTLSYYWNFGLPRPANYARLKYVS